MLVGTAADASGVVAVVTFDGLALSRVAAAAAAAAAASDWLVGSTCWAVWWRKRAAGAAAAAAGWKGRRKDGGRRVTGVRSSRTERKSALLMVATGGTVRSVAQQKGSCREVVTEAVRSGFGGSGLDGAPQSRDLTACVSKLARKNRAPFLERSVVAHDTAAPAEKKAGLRDRIHQSKSWVFTWVSTFDIRTTTRSIYHFYIGETTTNKFTDTR